MSHSVKRRLLEELIVWRINNNWAIEKPIHPTGAALYVQCHVPICPSWDPIVSCLQIGLIVTLKIIKFQDFRQRLQRRCDKSGTWLAYTFSQAKNKSMWWSKWLKLHLNWLPELMTSLQVQRLKWQVTTDLLQSDDAFNSP